VVTSTVLSLTIRLENQLSDIETFMKYISHINHDYISHLSGAVRK